MNILGVGGWELFAILLIMLIFAGPKRMMRWAYVLGTYLAKFRSMWAETVDVLQKEFDDAGVGIEIPKELPTRGSLNKQAGKALDTFTKPLKETMDQATADINQIKTTTAAAAKTASAAASGNGHSAQAKPAAPKTSAPPAKPNKPAAPPASTPPEFGAWSGQNDSDSNYGTWGDAPKNDNREN